MEVFGLNKTRDPNSLSWMPRNVPKSTSIWERGFYIKRDAVKYRHGLKRRVFETRTLMGKLLYFFILVFIFSVFSMPIYGGLGIVVVFETMIITVFLWAIVYSRTEYTEFNLKKDSVSGLRCYRENWYGDEDCLDFLFPRSTRAAISRPRCLDCTSLELNDIISVLIYNNNKSLFSLGVSCFFVVASGCLQSNMILLDRFAYHEEDHLNDYIDGVKAIIGREVWVDESEK